MAFALRGGVLMIGSLFWQDDLVPDQKDGIRKKWRWERLLMEEVSEVSVPIRYARFSYNTCYTMTYDHRLPRSRHGRAKAVPFRKTLFNSFPEIREEVGHLSEAEGMGRAFINGTGEPWGVCGILFRDDLDAQVVKEIRTEYEAELRRSGGAYRTFSGEPELYSITREGQMTIPWPESGEKFDFLLTASTKPKRRPGVEQVTSEEIARFVSQRPYFFENRLHGIITFEDEEILNYAT